MYFLTPFVLLFSVLALSSPLDITPLDKGELVRESIVNIHNEVVKLNQMVSNFNINDGKPATVLVQGIPILAGVAAVHFANREGFRRASESITFSKENTLNIIDTSKETVNISIIDTANLLRSKEVMFRQLDLTPLVLASLGLLEADHDSFSLAMALKFNSAVGTAKLGEAASVAANIHLVVQETVFYFLVAPFIGGDH